MSVLKYLICSLFICNYLLANPLQAPFELTQENCDFLQGKMDTPKACVVAFDSKNTPYLYDQHTTFISTLRNGQWEKLDFSQALKNAKLNWTDKRDPDVYAQMAFDKSNSLYLLIPRAYRPNGSYGNAILIYSHDMGKTFSAYPLPLSATQVVMENSNGENKLDNPPAIITSRFIKQLPGKNDYRWARLNIMHMFLPKKVGDKLEFGSPIEISDDNFGVTPHSGGDNVIASSGDMIYFVIVKCPKDLKNGGNPTYAMSLNRKTRKIVDSKFIMSAEPKWADIHSNPGLLLDYNNNLHVITGAHYGGSFLYRHTTTPNSIKNWSKDIVKVGDDQSYVAFVVDKKNTLHLTPRNGNRLEYQYKTINGNWSKPTILARRSKTYKGYCVFYHHLYIDNNDNLYLTFSYNDKFTKRRPKLIAYSNDYGKTWQLASTSFFKSQIGKD